MGPCATPTAPWPAGTRITIASHRSRTWENRRNRGSFCENGSLGDVDLLRAFIRARLDRYPSERGNLSSFLEGKTERLCAAESAARKARKGNQGSAEPLRPVLFGD
jgi:hypothetical protein